MSQATIYALSTVFGKSGVAVIRISGTEALSAVKYMTNIKIAEIKPRYAYFAKLHNSMQQQEGIDNALVLYFKAPNSFTGEDIVEFQVHGSKAVISSVLDSLSLIPDFKMAEPGEFSRRAFYNRKMDLTQAEGLADLIDAETAQQQKYALRQMEGNLKNLYDEWREILLRILAHLEAYIDFPDEDIPDNVIGKIKNDVFKLQNDISEHLNSCLFGERLREGFRVVIAGKPNAGKSSLLNALTGRKAAIVSEIAGTTRDAIDVHLDIRGFPVMITDTAGLRETNEQIEKQGIDVAYDKMKDADLIICLFDSLKDSVQQFDNLKKSFKNKLLYVANKSDKLTFEQCSKLKNQGLIVISAKLGHGLEELYEEIYNKVSAEINSSSGLLITRKRYREALNDVLDNLKIFSFDKEIELTAEDIRLAARALGKITGKIEVDEILDKIFGSFCIGK